MAGDLTVNRVQLGDSTTAANNFVWQTNTDGTAKLARGNIGATTQDILTVAADGKIGLPQGIGGRPAFHAYKTTLQPITANAYAKVTLDAELFDFTGAFDSTTNSRFQPNVAGYYQIIGKVAAVNSTGQQRVIATLYKNGVEYIRISDAAVNASYGTSQGSSIIYMNGTTDYLELWTYIIATTAILDNSILNGCYLQGYLIT